MTDDDITAHFQEDDDDDDGEEDYNIDFIDEKGLNHDEAFHSLETTMLWLEQQEEFDAVQLLSLKRLLI